MGPRGMGQHFTRSTETTVGEGRTETTEQQGDDRRTDGRRSQCKLTEDGQQWTQLMETSQH